MLPKFHPGLIYVVSACGININLYFKNVSDVNLENFLINFNMHIRLA